MFKHRPVYVEFVVSKVELGKVFFFLSTSIFPCQYYSTNAPYLFIHLPLALYNLST
jgi:hypothetical protein